jgi:hypothetical protein
MEVRSGILKWKTQLHGSTRKKLKLVSPTVILSGTKHQEYTYNSLIVKTYHLYFINSYVQKFQNTIF